MKRPRLAWFTPLPPMASGVSDYSRELLPFVAAVADVEAFCPRPGRFRRVAAPPGVPVRAPGEFPGEAAYEAVYFHLGNNPHHRFVYEAALEHRGIHVFHDLVLHHLLAHMWVESGLGRRDRDRYEAVFAEEYGQPAGRVLARLKAHGVATDFEKFLFPLTRHMARRAEGIVVHSAWARERIAAQAPGTPVEVIPHHAGAPPPEVMGVARAEARRRLRLPPNAFIVGHFGFVTRPKQPEAVMGGMAALRRERPDALMVVVGADTTGGGLDRILRRHGLERAVRPAGFVGLTQFYLYLKAVDAVINLRYPSAGESSGTLARALAEGRAVIVNDYHSFAELPSEAALKVEVDRPQAEQVGAHLVRLATEPSFKDSVEEAARAYARAVLAPERCRSLYVEFSRRVASEPSPRVARM